MNSFHRPFFFLVICISILGIFSWWKHNQTVSLCPHLDCIKMNGISFFQKKEMYSDTPQVYRALFMNGEQLLRIEVLHTSPTTASSELDATITKMKAMYEKSPAPYPGEVSDAIVCDPTFIPAYEELHQDNTRTGLFVGYLNNRLTFGSCSQDQAIYKGALALTYCAKKELLLRIELIAPTSYFSLHEKELIQQIKTLQCGK